METQNIHQKNAKTRPIIVLQIDHDCFDELVIDGFVMPPVGKSLEEGFALLDGLSEQYRQARNNEETEEELIDFVLRNGNGSSSIGSALMNV